MVSVVVPLYQRIDFLEHQLAQFVHDPEIQSAELIYVLDSPEMDERLQDLAHQLRTDRAAGSCHHDRPVLDAARK